MVKYREILRLAAMGVSQNGIAFSCGCAQSTVSDVLRAARAHKVAWPLPEEIDDAAIRSAIYPRESRKARDRAQICLPHLARTLFNLANGLYNTNRPSEAEPLFREALAILRGLAESGPARLPDVVGSLNNLAITPRFMDRTDEARGSDEAAAIRESLAKSEGGGGSGREAASRPACRPQYQAGVHEGRHGIGPGRRPMRRHPPPADAAALARTGGRWD